MENNNNVSNDGVFALLTYNFGDEIQSDVIFNVCTKCNWNLDDCMISLTKMQAQAKSGNRTKIESDADMVVESEETQNTVGDSENLIDLEEGVSNIDVEDGKVQLDSQPFTYAGAIKKTNRKFNNFSDTTDVAGLPIRPKPKAIFHDRPELHEISKQILKGIKVMVIMRGAPGSGKSYLSKEIIDATTCDDYCNHIFSSDDYFYDDRGNYNFSSHRLGEVHDNNRKRVNYYACRGWSPIIIDNTNMKVWEMKSYFDIAVRCGYVVHIAEAKNSWSQSPGKLAMKNSHGVPKESIERMLNGYEPTTVSSVMESFGLNYAMPMPQYRQFPPMNSTSTQLNNTIHQFTPKSQRTSVRHLTKRNNFDAPGQVPDLVQYESVEEAFRNVNAATEWTKFDVERVEFWKSNATQTGRVSPPKQQRNAKQRSTDSRSATVTNELHSNLFTLLKESNENAIESNKSPTEEEPKETMLHKHRKNCKNENDSFAQIRSIYPSVSLDVLWDLFEKCEGDGDWTMDILLKDETRVDEYHNGDGNVCGTRNDFECDCDGSNSKTINTDQTNVPSASIPDELSFASTYQRPRPNRVAINTEEQLAAKRMIEESFQIGDEHYSNHTRKIRNLRRGHVMSPAAGIVDSTTNTDTNTEESACAVDVVDTDSNEKDDELLEINLGMDLVCQLDSVFGVEAYQRDALENLKANVFMPKSLAQQLYALWMESMFNQLEEQRQKSIKEDAEFAKQLQSQQNYPGLHKHTKPPSDLKDIMEMEYALAAYRTEMDEWKSKTPQDLALQMTHDKLCNIFPDIDRDTLVEVLAAHNNKFSETVDVLKDTLSGKSADKIAIEGRQLLEEVQNEVEMTIYRSRRQTSLENRKLGPDEAKRYALKEFEDTRNLAMRHTQLKAECYNKAKEAIQRGNTSVALYYSQVANLHKTKIDAYNHKAANCIMEVHNLTQKNPDMLDLHYLHVNEAAECLDIFLDKHINKLKTQPQTYKYIFVITGRGLHSANGISTIKQKVKNRFRERNLTWSEVNPGLLKVKIFVNSRLTISV